MESNTQIIQEEIIKEEKVDKTEERDINEKEEKQSAQLRKTDKDFNLTEEKLSKSTNGHEIEDTLKTSFQSIPDEKCRNNFTGVKVNESLKEVKISSLINLH